MMKMKMKMNKIYSIQMRNKSDMIYLFDSDIYSNILIYS